MSQSRRLILFDLGDTLLDSQDRLLPHALEVLQEISGLRDAAGDAIPMGLVSDMGLAADDAERDQLRAEYEGIVRPVGLEPFFSPLSQKVTISSDVGFAKPDRRIFQAAIKK